MSGIEITGCNPKNLGDILMLEAAVIGIRDRVPSASFAVRRHSLLSKLASGAVVSYLPLLRPSGSRRELKLALNDRIFAPLANIGANYMGYARPRDFRAVVDVCGYKYGGVWGASAILADLREYGRLKGGGNKIVLLPKTYGPFEGETAQRHMRELVDLVDLCLVRDTVSYEHLLKAGVPSDRCAVFPDFTTTIEGILLPQHACYEGAAIVVPNFRMIDANTGLTEDAYLRMLSTLIEQAKSIHLKPIVLVHDSGKDDALAGKLAAGNKVPIVRESRAAVAKGLLRAASLVYSDRLHGLIGALSQGVPALTTGWTYKYVEILRSYGMTHCIVPPDRRDPRHFAECWHAVWENRESICAELRVSSEKIKCLNAQMWDRVADVLRTS